MDFKQTSFKQALGWWLAYLSLLAPVVVYSTVRFAPLYAADSLTTHAELSVIYKSFVSQTGILLAVALGIGAAVFGASRRSTLLAGVALLAGAATTIAALSIVPLVRFPEDQYPPAGLFVIADGLPLIIAFVVATLAARLLTASRATEVA
jgi:hypothetical protein